MIDDSDMPAIRPHDFHMLCDIRGHTCISFTHDTPFNCGACDAPNQITDLKYRGG